METSEIATLQAQFTQWLNCPMCLVLTLQEASLEVLTSAERTRLEAIQNVVRRTLWLKGRTALKQVLSDLGETSDTSLIRFPHARYSLTHSGEFAVAVGSVDSKSARGIGVDFECWRKINPKTTRFFLTEPEKIWLSGQPEVSKQREMLRLWTVKEALYKADLQNKNTSYHHYQTQEPEAQVGVASGNGATFCYAWVELPQGFLTVAIREDNDDASD